jgi:hypothetical protein
MKIHPAGFRQGTDNKVLISFPGNHYTIFSKDCIIHTLLKRAQAGLTFAYGYKMPEVVNLVPGNI